jgi:RNA polymerase sigma-70 factor (ECF subfamily)
MSASIPITTRWTVVWQAGFGNSGQMKAAREWICRNYWPPVYGYARAVGFSPQDAEDHTQSFFQHLIEDDWFSKVDREKGRLRSFLLATLRNFLNDERRRNRSLRRGGGITMVPLDAAESRFLAEKAGEDSPERIFQRQWALKMLEMALARIENEMRLAGKEALFRALRIRLSSSDLGDAEAVRTAAGKLGLSESATRTAIHRLRRRYGQILRNLVATTLATRDDALIDEEMRELRNAL